MPIPHRHDAFEETISGREGDSTRTIDGQPRALGPSESVCTRRGQLHGFDNRGSVEARFLAIAPLGVFGPAYSATSLRSSPPPRGGPPDLAALGQVMRRHGLTPAQPVAT